MPNDCFEYKAEERGTVVSMLSDDNAVIEQTGKSMCQLIYIRCTGQKITA